MKFTHVRDETRSLTVEITDDGEYTLDGDETAAGLARDFLDPDNQIKSLRIDHVLWEYAFPVDPIHDLFAVMQFLGFRLDESTATDAERKVANWFRNGGSDFPPPEGSVY